MQKFITIPALVCLFAVTFLVPAKTTMGQMGLEALKNCSNLGFSTEEDFVTWGPEPADGNPIISDGDLLGLNHAVCARNADLLGQFDIKEDLGLDAVHIIDADRYLVAFSTELDSPNPGQFTAGDFLITNGGIIPNMALLYKFDNIQGDLGLDAVQVIGNSVNIKRFLDYAKTVPREQWLTEPGVLAEMLDIYDIDILFSTEGTGPSPDSPIFLDGDFLSARFGVIVQSNGSLLPNTVPAGVPVRGVDFGLDAGNMVPGGEEPDVIFSTELLYQGNPDQGAPDFTDGDVLQLDNGVVFTNKDLISPFEPRADFLGLDAFFSAVSQDAMELLISQIKEAAGKTTEKSKTAGQSGTVYPLSSDRSNSSLLQLEACRAFAFSTEEDFVTRGPEPPDGNPIISDGDLLGRNCAVCARNHELLQNFDVSTDLGLDAVDVIDVESELVAFSTELDSPHAGQFTAGDLLVTNGTIIPNTVLLELFNIRHDMGLDALFFVGDPERISGFLSEAREFPRQYWLRNPDELVGMLRQWQIDIWFSVEGTGPLPGMLTFLDGDILSARDGVVIASNDILLPSAVPAGIPSRGVDFGLDSLGGHRDGMMELINFSTEILFNGEPGFNDGDVLESGNGVVITNEDLTRCLEPMAGFLGLDALSGRYLPPCEGNFDHDEDVDRSDLAVFAAEFGRTDCGVPTTCPGDFDTDGDVDGRDLAVFAADYGRTDCPE